MKIEEAVKKAIEGGWRNNAATTAYIWCGDYENILLFLNGYNHLQFRNKENPPPEPVWEGTPSCLIQEVFLDPKFWQSLGKAMGWRQEPFFPRDILDREGFEKNNPDHWKEKWHKFIDYLAEGKTAEDYFKTL